MSNRRLSSHPARRWAARGAAIALIAPAITLVPGTASAAPEDPAEGLARVIASDLLTADLADAVSASSGSQTDQGPNTAAIDAEVLNSLIGVQLPTIGLPLIASGGNPGLLDLGDAAAAGALNAASASPADDSSVAAAGAVGDNGAIDLGTVGDPTTIGDARLDLTALLGQLGVDDITDTVVDQLSVELGALASRAAQTGDAEAERTYGLAGAQIAISSPAVDTLATDLETTILDAGNALNAAVGPGGAIDSVAQETVLDLTVPIVGGISAGPGTVTAALDLQPTVDAILATPLTSSDGIVTVDLDDGLILVNVAKLLKGPDATDLNGLSPNTQVLTAATIDQIGAGIADALGGLGETAGELIDAALNAATLTLDVPVTVTLLGQPAVDLSSGVSGSLGGFLGLEGSTAPTVTPPPAIPVQLADPLQTVLNDALAGLGGALSGVLEPVTTGLEGTVNTLVGTLTTAIDPLLTAVLPNIAQLTINQQTTADPDELENTTGSATVRALDITLLPTLAEPLARVGLASSTVRVDTAAEPAPTLTGAPDEVRPGQTVDVTTEGWEPDTELDLTYVDADGNEIGTSTVTTNGEGVATDTFTVPDGTPVGDLTITATAEDGTTASDTVTVLAPPTLAASPASVPQEGTVNVTGEGWPADTEVTVTYTDAEGNPVGENTVTTSGDGTLTDTLTLPPGTAPGTLTIVATGPDGLDATTTTQVEAAPVLTAAPGEVSAGDTVAVSSAGWPVNTPLTVTFTDADGNEIGTQPVTTDANGTFSTTFEVPAGTALGTLDITAADGAGRTASAEVEVVADPVITVTPPVAAPGDTITTDGSGYPPNTDVTVTYTDADGNEIGEQTVTTDENGDFTTDFVVPDGTPPGDLTVDATDENGNTATETVTITESNTPAIATVPGTVHPGDTITTVGAGYPPNTDVTVTYTDADGNDIGEQTVTTDDGGTFTTEFVVPDGTPEGALTIEASDDDGNTATDTVTVEAEEFTPAVIAAPSTVEPGDTVAVVGTGYPPNTDVTVTYTDADGNDIGEQTVTTNENGIFTTSFLVPDGTPAGPLTISAADADGNTAEDEVAVEEPAFTPTLTAAPDTVSYGQGLAVAGSGWPAGVAVTLVYTAADGTEVGRSTVLTDGDGNLSDSFTVPAGTALGELTVTATGGDGLEASATSEVVASPAITVTPPVAAPGDTITTDGSGYPPNTDVTVNYTDADGNDIGEQTVTTDENGDFTTDFVVPDGTPPGDLTVDATDENGNTATETVEVADANPGEPTITAGPDTVTEGDTVFVLGAGFSPNSEVTVTFTDADGNEAGSATATSDDDGTFTAEFVVPEDTAIGELSIAAEDADGNTATDSVTVEEAPAPGEPALSVDPDTVNPGDTITVDGSGYAPNSEVTIIYTDADGNVIGEQTVTTDENGDFTTEFVVPEDAVTGPLTIVATDADGNSANAVVQVAAAGDGGAPGSGGGDTGAGAGTGGSGSGGYGSSRGSSWLPNAGAPVALGGLLLGLALLVTGAAGVVTGRTRGRARE